MSLLFLRKIESLKTSKIVIESAFVVGPKLNVESLPLLPIENSEGIDPKYLEDFKALAQREIETDIETPKSLNANLREYQQIGYSWLKNLNKDKLYYYYKW